MICNPFQTIFNRLHYKENSFIVQTEQLKLVLLSFLQIYTHFELDVSPS